jgi:hypothetical protein
MRIGVDLDNTIICLDRVFHAAAVDEGLIPPHVLATKSKVKQAILNAHDDAAWTRVQGIVYGSRLHEAEPYEGVMSFFVKCQERGVPAFIISHKTRYPVMGSNLDMREAAMEWLAMNGWFNADRAGLSNTHVEFADTRAAKTAAIVARNCSVFIDDLPEVFLEPGFPGRIRAILFDPDRHHTNWSRCVRATTWPEITASVFLS